MSGTEIYLECGEPGCTESFATGRSLWKDAAIEGAEAGWDTESDPELCPEHKKKEAEEDDPIDVLIGYSALLPDDEEES